MSDDQTSTPPSPPPASTEEQVSAKGSYQLPADYYSSSPAPQNDRPGCPKWLPIGCGLGGCLVLILLFVGAGFLVQERGGALTVWFVTQMNEDVQRRLTVDVPAEQRAELANLFKQLETFARAEKLSIMELQNVMQEYRNAVSDNRIDGVEAREIANAAQPVVAQKSKR